MGIEKFTNLQERAIGLGLPISKHMTDLYLPYTVKVKELLENYKWNTEAHISDFISAVDGERYYEIVFAYDKEAMEDAVKADLYEWCKNTLAYTKKIGV